VAFNGPGGIEARPTPQEEAYGRERHIEAVAAQREHEQAASHNRALFASENHGRPAIAATGRPGEFSGAHIERASAAGEAYRAPRMSPAEARGPAAGSHGFNDSARPVNHEAGNREPMSSRDNARPNKQEKQAQKRADKQAKAEQKRNER